MTTDKRGEERRVASENKQSELSAWVRNIGSAILIAAILGGWSSIASLREGMIRVETKVDSMNKATSEKATRLKQVHALILPSCRSCKHMEE